MKRPSHTDTLVKLGVALARFERLTRRVRVVLASHPVQMAALAAVALWGASHGHHELTYAVAGVIAKVPPKRTDGASSFKSLEEYITDARKCEHAFGSEHMLGADGRVDLEDAAARMKAIGDMNPACKDPVHHIILSWPKYERPSREQIEQAVRMQMDALGYGKDHQWLGATHTDQDNIHVHIAVNRVSTVDFRANYVQRDYFVMDRTCRQIELTQGWSEDRGPYCRHQVGDRTYIVEAKDKFILRQLSEGAKKYERYTGQVSLEGYLRDGTEGGRPIGELIASCDSWQEVHGRLAVLGLDLERVDRGLVVKDQMSDTRAKLSFAGPACTLPALEKRLGVYETNAAYQAQESQVVLADLTRMQAVFSERDIDAYVSLFVAPERRDTVKAMVMADEGCVHLVGDDRKVARFTRSEVLAEETRILNAARRIDANNIKPLSEGAIRAGILDRHRAAVAYAEQDRRAKGLPPLSDPEKARLGLNEDQMAAYMAGCQAGGISATRGFAGTGKSFMMQGWRAAYEADGYTVVGLAPTSKVVKAMERDGFDASTIDGIIVAWQRDPSLVNWGRGTVIIVDEAGMASNHHLDWLTKIATERGCTIRCVGDPAQLDSVNRGGMYATLAAEFPAGTLSSITRQHREIDRQIVAHFERGEIEPAMAKVHDQGYIHWADSRDDAHRLLLEDWRRIGGPSVFISAYERRDVVWFNRECREHLKETGVITGWRQYRIGGLEMELGRGDRVVVTDNTWVMATLPDGRQDRLKLTNGSGGTIVNALPSGRVEVKFDGLDKPITITLGNGKGELAMLDHYLAGTVYKSQGDTVIGNMAFYTPSSAAAAGGILIPLSRHKEWVRMYAAKEDVSCWRGMVRQIERARHKEAAINIERSPGRHEPKPVAGVMTEAVERLAEAKVAEAKGSMVVTPDSARQLPDALDLRNRREKLLAMRGRYETEVEALHQVGREAWNRKIGEYRQKRDGEVAALQAKHGGERERIWKLKKVPFETKSALVSEYAANIARPERAAMKERHNAERDAIGKPPERPTFEAWLDQQVARNDKDAIAAKRIMEERQRTREPRGIKVNPEHLIDLCDLARDHGYVLKGAYPSTRSEGWVNETTGDRIIIQCDGDGRGVRWLSGSDPDRVNGAARQLAEHLNGGPIGKVEADKVTATLMPYYTKAKAEMDADLGAAADRQEHRMLDVTEFRRRWEGGAQLQPVKATEEMGLSVETLAAFGGEIRIDQRHNLIIPRRDLERNIVGFDVASADRCTMARGSAKALSILGESDPEKVRRIVLVEDPRDALRVAEVDGAPAGTIYLSTGYLPTKGQLAQIRSEVAAHPTASVEVVLGDDRQRMAPAVRAAAEARGVDKPTVETAAQAGVTVRKPSEGAKDWSKAVKQVKERRLELEREHIREQQQDLER